MNAVLEQLDKAALAELCDRVGIRRLSVFGSAVRDDFTEASDIDLLAEFIPSRVPGLIRYVGIEQDFSEFFHRKVDLCTPGGLSKHILADVLSEAKVLYDQ